MIKRDFRIKKSKYKGRSVPSAGCPGCLTMMTKEGIWGENLADKIDVYIYVTKSAWNVKR